MQRTLAFNGNIIQGRHGECFFLGGSGAKIIKSSVYFPDKNQTFPSLEVFYPLDELSRLSYLFAAMEDMKTMPEIFLWNTHRVTSDLLILFRLERPTIKLLESITGGRRAANPFLRCKDVHATVAEPLDHIDARALTHEFARRKKIFIYILESMDTSAINDPLHYFPITCVQRRKPEFYG